MVLRMPPNVDIGLAGVLDSRLGFGSPSGTGDVAWGPTETERMLRRMLYRSPVAFLGLDFLKLLDESLSFEKVRWRGAFLEGAGPDLGWAVVAGGALAATGLFGCWKTPAPL